MAWGSPLPDDSTRSNATQRDREAKIPRNGSGIYSKPAGTTAVASTTIESAKYNSVIDDLVTDANTARPIVAGGTGATTAGAALTALGAQPLDAGLTSIAGLTTAADRMIYTTAADTYAVATLTAAGRAILDDADAAAQRTTLGAQASDATLTSLSGLSLVEGDILYATGADTLARLPKGTAGQVLAMNSGATAPGWAAGGLFFRLNSAHAGANDTTLQNFFPQAVTLEASTVYEYEFWIGATKTAGTTSHSFSVGFGGTHTRNNTFRHLLTSGQNNSATSATVLTFIGFSAAATDVVVTTFNAANGTIWHREFGSFSVNASGTWFPAYQLSAAPGGAWSTAAGSFVGLRKLGASGSNSSQGAWA